MSHVCPSHACPQHLYADALHSIFTLLSLKDTAPVLATCKHWLEACKSERKSRGLTIRPSVARLRAVSQSFLRKHVSCIDPNASIWWLRSQFGPTALALLHRLPNLTSADICLSISAFVTHWAQRSSEPAVDLFPRTLRHLSIEATQGGPSPANPQFMEAIGRVHSLTSLSLDLEHMQGTQLAPLVGLPHLRSLSIHNGQFDAANVAALQQLSALERLAVFVGSDPAGFIEDLLTPPHSLAGLRHLEFVNNSGAAFALTAETICLLAAACPHLETLLPTRLQPEALPELGSLTALRTLRIHTSRPTFHVVKFAADLPSIIHCRSLTDLTLDDFDAIGEPQFRRLAAGLPDLRALSLMDCSLTTLAPLRSLAHLSSLTVLQCRDFSAAKLSTLSPFPQLRSIHIQLYGNKYRTENKIRERFPGATDVRVEKVVMRH